MNIRKARIEDAVSVTQCILVAMQDLLFKFIGDDDAHKVHDLMLHFVMQKNNQYSFANCFVAELDQQVVGAVNIYDGARLKELSDPFIQYIREKYNPQFNPEPETQAGEFYIDTLGVLPLFQGKGIGTQLLQYVIVEYVQNEHHTLGLLVDTNNDSAKRLYTRLGLQVVAQRSFMGKLMEHMQIKPY